MGSSVPWVLELSAVTARPMASEMFPYISCLLSLKQKVTRSACHGGFDSVVVRDINYFSMQKGFEWQKWLGKKKDKLTHDFEEGSSSESAF